MVTNRSWPHIEASREQIAMRISRKAAALAAAALAGLASLGAAGAAFASSSTPQANDNVQVLRLHADFVAAADNSAGHGGPGDVLAALFNIRTRGGAHAGTESVSLLSIPGHQTLGHSAFALKGGQIDAMGTLADTATRFTAAIIGGTGIYDGVTGQILNVESASGIDLTFYIIRPDHD
jgi:hypothetical protein